MLRADGREAHQVRGLQAAVAVLPACTGSAMVEVGGSKVVCAVRGPQQMVNEYRGNRGQIVCAMHRPPFAQKNRSDPTMADVLANSEQMQILRSIIEQTVILERIPQLAYSCDVEIVSSAGEKSDLCVAVAAACLALSNAGVELFDLVAATTAVLRKDGSTLVDPTPTEAQEAVASCVVCVSLATGSVLYMSHEGSVEPGQLRSLLAPTIEAALSLRGSLRTPLLS